MNLATPVRLSSPRRVSLDANTPIQDRAAQGPNLRPSPYQRRSPRLELLREAVSSHDPLIKLSVDVRLKNTVYQRLSSSGRIGTHRVQCDTWDEMKLWDIIQRELNPLAVPTGTPPVWTVDEHDPAIEMFEKYTSMRMNTKMLNPWTSAKDRRHLSQNQHEIILLSVYKYGNDISTVGQLADFEDQCISPASTDHGGAATEELHQLMISSLKGKGGRYVHCTGYVMPSMGFIRSQETKTATRARNRQGAATKSGDSVQACVKHKRPTLTACAA